MSNNHVTAPSQILAMRLPQVRVAFVLMVAAVDVLVVTALAVSTFGHMGMLPANLLAAAVLLAVAGGCWQLKKWAWWVGAVGSGLWGLPGLMMIPAAIQMVSMPPRGGAGMFGASGYLYFSLILTLLMCVAFLLFISPSCRREFGIGQKQA